MGWTESGIFANVLIGNLSVQAAPPAGYPNWVIGTNKMALYDNSVTPNWQAAAGSSIYTATGEVHDSSAWPATGVAFSALNAGGDMGANWAITGSAPTTTLNYKATSNVSVASTTLASPGAYGCYLYWAAGTTKYSFIGIYFGGTGYITTNGTFTITWSSSTIATFALAG